MAIRMIDFIAPQRACHKHKHKRPSRTVEDMAINRRIVCGLDLCSVPDISISLQNAASAGYDYIAYPIVHPRFKREFLGGKAKDRPGPFSRSDMLLAGQDWSTLIIGRISHTDKVDSPIESIRRNAEAALEQDLVYASHLGLPAILILLKNKKCVNLARHIHNRVLASVTFQNACQVWVQVPMHASQDLSKMWLNNADAGGKGDATPVDNNYTYHEDTWEWWNLFRSICNFEKKVGLALEVTADVPSVEVLKRWLGEPVNCLIIPTHVFLTNKKGFPVLSRPHQTMVRSFFRMNIQVLISGANRHSNVKLYQQYIEYLWQNQPCEDSVNSFARGYEDYLQCPLQPLMDNLESQTYEIFEKDPIKYSEYQKAMFQAIKDKSMELNEDRPLVLMVVGAGRGPLVRAALVAAERAKQKVKIYAVEKNPNAVLTLLAHQDEMWGDSVTVISTDMRDWHPEEKADILVSELLGSFGDNELSPECLDGAQTFLKDDGISIPSSYTSFLSPIQSSKLYNEVRLIKERDKSPLIPFESPYVVHLHNIFELAAPQPLFTFVHPNHGIKDNTRYKVLNFTVNQDSILHGFAGYFETILYKDISLSIVPQTHSPGMFSWFPIMFPIKDSVSLSKDCEVEVHFWRCNNKRNVWYEWLISKPQVVPIHNPNGRSYTIGL